MARNAETAYISGAYSTPGGARGATFSTHSTLSLARSRYDKVPRVLERTTVIASSSSMKTESIGVNPGLQPVRQRAGSAPVVAR